MKKALAIILFSYLTLNRAFGGAIDDVVAKFDRYGLWANGMFIPISAPQDIKDEILAGKILSSYRKSSEGIAVLEKQEISSLKIGLSGYKAVYVRVNRTSLFPSPARDYPEYWVIVYRFSGDTRSWWSRLYPVDAPKMEPNQTP